MENKIKYRFKDHEDYMIRLAGEPQEDNVKERSLGGSNVHCYLPIEVVEITADYVFREWHVIDEDFSNVLNELVCTVKIEATPDYPDAMPIRFTGSASKAIPADKGSKAEEFPLGKKTNALQYCLPAVRSDAIGCALESLGNVFGRNVSRKNASNDYSYDLKYENDEEKKD